MELGKSISEGIPIYMTTRNIIGVGILAWALAQSSTWAGAGDSTEIARLSERVAQLEKQVLEMSQLLEPLKAQQLVENRRKSLRAQFDRKMAQDQQKYTPEQLRDAEKLYQVANQKWGSTEAADSLQQLIQKYPDINRTGCATLYVAQKSQGDERSKYLRECFEKFGDCIYGDGVQVGAFARYLLSEDYRSSGQAGKAEILLNEIRTKYPEAVDHRGGPLLQSQKAN
jgi:hypothetical protein